MTRSFRWAIGLTLLLLVAYLGIAFLMVRGATSTDREPVEGHPADFGLAYEDVSFEARGGGPLLRGWYLDSASEGPALIFVHGIGGQRGGDGAVALAAELVRAGYDVLLFDLRGHGESEGDRVSGGYFERRDVLGAYDLLIERGARPGGVGIIGFSMGAGIAVMVAAQEPGIAAVVADSPFADVDDLIAQETAGKTPIPRFAVPLLLPPAKLIAEAFYDIDLGELVPERAAGELDYPVLVIHGEADTRIPVSHGRRVHDNAPAGSELWTLPGVEHVDAYLKAPDEYVARLTRYFASRLR
jgi:pimeloyl-ACP methyl ester carboxylesterase